jgi:hypothetical protein
VRKGTLDFGGFGAIDSDIEFIAGENESLSSNQARGVSLGVRDRAKGADFERAARGQIVHGCDVDAEFEAGACGERGECFCGEVCEGDLLAHACEGGDIACGFVLVRSCVGSAEKVSFWLPSVARRSFST